jgi:DNA-binding transcriptional MerR regulator
MSADRAAGRDALPPGRAVQPRPEVGDALYKHRIEALEELTGVKVRTIRLWQDRGLLPAPHRVGRIAYYTDDDVVRVQLVDRLLRRGYTLGVIAELLEAWGKGRNLEDVLGLEKAVSSPWTDEAPSHVTTDELRQMFGSQVTPGNIERAVALGILQPAGPESFDVPHPGLLTAGRDLVALGMPLHAVLEVVEQVQVELDKPADRLVRMVNHHVFAGRVQSGMPEAPVLKQMIDVITMMRPHALLVVDALFSRSLTRSVDSLFSRMADTTVTSPVSGAPAGDAEASAEV